MEYRPFEEDQQTVYADEQENVLFRVKDFKALIEEHIHLPVTDLSLMSLVDNPDHLRDLYGDLEPDRVWFVLATITTPEGEATSEVFVMLKKGKLSIPKKMFLHLKTFGSSARRKATEEGNPFTRDYIYTLEESVSDAWRFWRDLCYYASRHQNEPAGRDLREHFTGQLNRLYKTFQDVGFLDGKEKRHNPFPTGFTWHFGQPSDDEEEE